jgi:hypothetical protein
MQLPWKAFTLPGSKVKREIFNWTSLSSHEVLPHAQGCKTIVLETSPLSNLLLPGLFLVLLLSHPESPGWLTNKDHCLQIFNEHLCGAWWHTRYGRSLHRFLLKEFFRR